MEHKNIDPEDLLPLESDLTRDELVSILFLLYGFDKPKWILEELQRPTIKNYLHDYATHHSNWKTAIIEALAVTRIFEMVQNLGVASSEAREIPPKCFTIISCLKLLYQLCEACSQEPTEMLISHIKGELNKRNCLEAQNCHEDMLEFYLLHCIVNKLIKVSASPDDCDFSFITEFFNKNKFEGIDEVLIKFPKKSNSLDNSTNEPFNSVILSTTQNKAASLVGEYQTKNLHVLIINQQTFEREKNPELQNLLPDHELTERRGTAKDAQALQLLFEGFGYRVTIKPNLPHNQLLTEVVQATKRASESDGLIVCILSHGNEGIVYGHNSIPVRIKDIRHCMASSSLLEKSKILLIQACQGNTLQRSVKKLMSKLEHDGPTLSTFVTSGSVYADFLIFWSTIEGFASVRHVDNGSWFIQEVVKKIRELHNDQHLMDICTAVIKEVSLKRGYGDECMLPKLEATFTRNFRFPESKEDSSC